MRIHQFIFSIAVCLFLSACVVPPAPTYYRAQVVYPDALPGPVVTDVALPATQYEVMGQPTVSGYFWIPGVWLWVGNRYVWQSGYWSAPRPGYTWVPHRWSQQGRSWHMNGGYWLRH
jgi:hypothetical protein